MPLQFILSRRGVPQLYHDNYVFNKYYQPSSGQTYWACRERNNLDCKCCCSTKDDEFLEMTKEHNHDPLSKPDADQIKTMQQLMATRQSLQNLKVHFFTSKQGNDMMMLDGYRFRTNVKHKNLKQSMKRRTCKQIKWVCSKYENKRKKCSCRCFTEDGRLVQVRGQHNHERPNKSEMEELKEIQSFFQQSDNGANDPGDDEDDDDYLCALSLVDVVYGSAPDDDDDSDNVVPENDPLAPCGSMFNFEDLRSLQRRSKHRHSQKKQRIICEQPPIQQQPIPSNSQHSFTKGIYFFTSKKGNPMMVHNGFRFCVQNYKLDHRQMNMSLGQAVHQHRINWRCSKFNSLGCPCRCFTVNGQLDQVRGVHNHDRSMLDSEPMMTSGTSANHFAYRKKQKQ